MIYLLDANIFIEAYQRYYSKELVPSFWEFLRKDDEIFTIKEVKVEIEKGHDDLPNLIEEVKIHSSIHRNSDSSNISEHVRNNYPAREANGFLDGADFFLVCAAKTDNFTVVTHEILKGRGSKKPSIPGVCMEFAIPWMNTFQMLKKKSINLSSYNLKEKDTL